MQASASTSQPILILVERVGGREKIIFKHEFAICCLRAPEQLSVGAGYFWPVDVHAFHQPHAQLVEAQWKPGSSVPRVNPKVAQSALQATKIGSTLRMKEGGRRLETALHEVYWS